MKSILWCLTLVLASLATVALVQANEEKVPLDKLPKAVVDAVKKRFPAAELVSAEKETDAGKTVYEVAIKNKEQSIEVTLTPEGTITEIETKIEAKGLPMAVTQALEKKYPKATYQIVEEIVKVKDGKDEPAYYEVLLVTADKKKLEVVLTAEGKITKVEDKSKEKE